MYLLCSSMHFCLGKTLPPNHKRWITSRHGIKMTNHPSVSAANTGRLLPYFLAGVRPTCSPSANRPGVSATNTGPLLPNFLAGVRPTCSPSANHTSVFQPEHAVYRFHEYMKVACTRRKSVVECSWIKGHQTAHFDPVSYYTYIYIYNMTYIGTYWCIHFTKYETVRYRRHLKVTGRNHTALDSYLSALESYIENKVWFDCL